MNTIKQKLENFVNSLEKKHPALIKRNMYLGTKDHPDLQLYERIKYQVGEQKFFKWRIFKYILKNWEDKSSIVNRLRSNGYYAYAKQVKIEERIWKRKNIS